MGIKRFIAALFASVGGYAQTDSLENAYYKTFDNMLATQVYTLSTSNTFSLYYPQENLTVDLVPNSRTTLGAAVQYNIISLSLGFAPSFFDDNKDNHSAKSKMTNFSFGFFPGRFMQHFDFVYQKGLSLQVDGGELYLPQMKSLKIGGSTAYMFNRNFSFRATSFQNAKQLKSAGTFAPTLSYYYTELNSKKQPEIGGKIYFVDVAVAPAYYYNWVIAKDFLLSGGMALGAGFTTTVDDNTTTSLLINGSLHLAAGYNGKRFFCGFNSRAMFFTHNSGSSVEMNDVTGYGTLFAGYRFDEPTLLKKQREKIEKWEREIK
ncbi:hypothetical protein AM493_14735 [Flavobacterium akiainvivens]|uniref:DUF4421 domain-containing protein n=1 Tax=Flavobacterium akiainvivens TaxID=1202724 RepID=A0A0N0RQX2_9FLAO|nr:DUF4421 family protein [Flavobacterium akiainvivens]KOS07156.1 hypothetical protein AM493_14735 [Flavobacterium akiainvivens]SFQ73129.1 protein of unknown function [Flavobacterium akiainvivens]